MNNPLFGGTLGSFGGIRIIEDIFMTDTVEDWSGCRSIPRAKRRHARGIKTRMRYIKVPKKEGYFIKESNTLVVHPEVRKLLSEELKKDPEQMEAESYLRKERPQADPSSPWHQPLSWTFPNVMRSSIFNTDVSS